MSVRGLEIWLPHNSIILLGFVFIEDIVNIISVSVNGILMICWNSQGNDPLNENTADSIFGCFVINSYTELMK